MRQILLHVAVFAPALFYSHSDPELTYNVIRFNAAKADDLSIWQPQLLATLNLS
jgi:hypothetical protein